MRSFEARLGASLALVVLLLPAAAASSSAFQIEGSLIVPAASDASYRATAFFLSNASALSALKIVGAAHFCHNERDLQDVQIPPLGEPLTRLFQNGSEGCFDTPALKVSLAEGSRAGWIGGRLDGPSRLTVSTRGVLDAAPSDSSMMTSPDAAYGSKDEHDAYNDPSFFELTAGPHVSAIEAGLFRYHGKGEVKLRGPAIMAETPTNSTGYQTGDSVGSDIPVHQTTWRWVTIDFDGDLVLDSAQAPVQIQATEATVSWDGAAHFVAGSGSLDMDGTTQAMRAGEPVSVDGRFLATIVPSAMRANALDVALRGEARSMTVAGVRVASVPGAPGAPWSLVAGLALGSVVVLGGASAALRRHARPRRAVEARRLEDEAARLLEREGRERDALDLYRASLRLASSGRASLSVALILRRRGETRGALHHFGKAAKTCVGGAAEHGAILCALDMGDLVAARSWAVSALARDDLDPAILSALAVDRRFAGLREEPSVRVALDAATQRQAARGWPSLL
ncbi:MAG: hypothetical protein QOE90_2853 [Thermoplasmata archaeon]|jgi:hypothetical protein|nr:hypothetical protein [Thermoplasmata archaeon]